MAVLRLPNPAAEPVPVPMMPESLSGEAAAATIEPVASPSPTRTAASSGTPVMSNLAYTRGGSASDNPASANHHHQQQSLFATGVAQPQPRPISFLQMSQQLPMQQTTPLMGSSLGNLHVMGGSNVSTVPLILGASENSNMLPNGQMLPSSNNGVSAPWASIGGSPLPSNLPLGVPMNTSLLGTVTVGAGTNNGGRGRLAKNVQPVGRALTGRTRLRGAPPRPPLLPMPSTPTQMRAGGGYAVSNEEQQYPQQRAPLQAMKGLANNNAHMNMGVNSPSPDTPMIEFGAESSAPFVNPMQEEVALTTDLVTLSVHEALTFEGVELALHPDVFANGNKKNDKKGDGEKSTKNQQLRPGDLVEIRVWSARPGITVSKTPSKVQSATQMKPTAGRTSIHTRNTSLATVTSSICNASLMNTPAMMNNVLQGQQTPPLPRVVGGDAPPLPKVVGGDGLSSSIAGSLSRTGSSASLRGEHLLSDSPAATGPNLSSVFAGASNLLRKMAAAPSNDTEVPNDAASALSLSQESSTVTTSPLIPPGGGTHSRDSSWLNALHTSNNSLEDASQLISPSTTIMESLSEGQPLVTTNQSQHSTPTTEGQSPILPMRRNSASLAGPTPPLPPHPLTSSSLFNVLTSETTTPSSSHPSSPRSQLPTPISTPPTKQRAPQPTQQTETREQGGNSAAGGLSLSQPSAKKALLSDTTKKENKLLPATLLTPDFNANPGDSGPDTSAQVDSSPLHTRNNTIAMTGILNNLSSSGANNPANRNNLHRSASSSLPSSVNALPPSSTKTLPQKTKADPASIVEENNGIIAQNNINDMLHETHFLRVSFVLPVSERSLSVIKKGARTQVSLLRQLADLYGITAYDTVTVTQVTRSKAPFVRQEVTADFLTISFKDQFVSRCDIYGFLRHFGNSWVYEGKRLTFNGIRTNTKVIRHGDHVIRSGLITEDTKLTFRSRSARIIWLVQLSSEMWEHSSPYEAVGQQTSQESSCRTYFDKFVEFARRLFDKWKKLQLSHNLTVVFFSRTYIHNRGGGNKDKGPAIHVDSDGRLYSDHYKIVLDNETSVRSSGESMIHRMKKEFVKYPKSVKWSLTPGLERTPSTASQGNVLEAINITLNLLRLHYIDRDLHRTGNSIVIITPGNGVFEIDKGLAGITKQRMMDNGIGSDMLSLGLPPLHVAPFFLYKGVSDYYEDDVQGFDELTKNYEVPHWMNLSFVDYDTLHDEGPSLYKEADGVIADTASGDVDDQGEIEAHFFPSNGFLVRNTPEAALTPEAKPSQTNLARHQKKLISDRGFKDILQACRPRNRGEFGSGLPAPLSSLLKKVEQKSSGETASLDLDKHQQPPLGEVGLMESPNRAFCSRSRYMEWGAVDFDSDCSRKNSLGSSRRIQFNRSLSGGDSQSSSPSSSFTSIGSCRLSSSLGMSHLQSLTSLESGHNRRQSDNSLVDDAEKPEIASLGNSQSLAAIQNFMANHDESAFSGFLKIENAKVVVEDSGVMPGSPLFSGRALPRSQSVMFPVHKKGGIEAALLQHDVKRNEQDSAPKPGTAENIVHSEEAVGQSLAVSPLNVGHMPYSLDRRSEGLRPSVMRLVAPDIMPRASRLNNISDGFQVLDSQRRMNSFHQHQGNMKSQDATTAHQKNKLGDNRNFQQMNRNKNNVAGTMIHLQQKTPESVSPEKHSPQFTKDHKQSRKPHSHRHRRKPWVLNPFRQEDEDEVLATRTHNRRRWSHVFPLGENEFKRHAGPNWKSLCQPAILPMTIDFHPAPKDLEDLKKFSVKQYSVTLPPLDETTYASHKDLLDDLLIQRLRQDFQIVPRDIIHTRPDVIGNTLERTLSMGHKIQRLSYNPSTDSVDVVQYYANFAENEAPQTYRYLLWSALRQNYVAVTQTFTKYTTPYKWNELDMLISGDEVNTILEGMRYPRISFVIIPDAFNNVNEEKEYINKFNRLIDYFTKIQSKEKSMNIEIDIHSSDESGPRASSGAKHFTVDLRKKREDKYEWMELVHDSNCDTRRTFRMTFRWLVAVGNQIDQQAQLLSRRCSQYGLKLISVPHFSCLNSCFMNPFSVPITVPIQKKSCVDTIESALTTTFSFVYDGEHMSDPNDIENLDGFDFVTNKWSMKKRKKFVPARQYLHRTGTLFTRFLRDTKGNAIVIIYMNLRHIAKDDHLLQYARALFCKIEQFIAEECKKAGC